MKIKTAKTKTLFFIVWDIILISLAVYLSFILRFDADIPAQFSSAIQLTIILALIFHLPIYYFWGLYSFSWSYVSTRELISLVQAATLGFLFVTATIFISRDYPSFFGFPRSTLFISYFLVLLFSGGIRFSKRIYLQTFKKGKHEEKERTLIIGKGVIN